MTTVAIIDYGRGNVRSVANAIEACGADALVTSDSTSIEDASHIILPGVGAFGDAMAALHERGLPEILRCQILEKGKPFLGVCLGMQLLADCSSEHGKYTGLGLITGEIIRLAPGADMLKIPHMGWNTISVKRPHALFKGLQSDQLNFYFVHSYYFQVANPDSVIGVCDYGLSFPAVVGKDNIVAVQFHPEKSQDSGIEVLENFISWSP
ncbi:MAG TPA: imidazole glycerol phosphate synthase subunit HisH [Rhodospirillaceae bacterium]|nr:imidazole glycerol phosphate synthase subunit HisH [Candidatus Neomarinimicrobiota bacterium]HCX13797.1 imidazole glycerol phosphate synthase subunit HisH [Rhodospirillaceae bacterium]